MSWTVRSVDGNREREFETRSGAENAMAEMEALDVEVELVPPASTDGGVAQAQSVEPVEPVEETAPETVDPEEFDLAGRTVSDNPLNWVPGDFVDEIDGSPAINRMGFEVLGHFYGVDVEATLEVAPEETDFEFCRVKAIAKTPEGRTCEAFGSAHVDRGDDSWLLLEMADTRARKRALSIATGTGACAVDELRNEVSE